jgi:hypothetical protein
MKKIPLLTKTVFHASNIGLILIYFYPGSVFGWLLYGNLQKQPQLTSDFMIFSLNHVCAFVILSLLGVISYKGKKIAILFIYLFFISIVLEFSHALIPERSFEYSDLFGNFFGVILIFISFNLYKFFKNQ